VEEDIGGRGGRENGRERGRGEGEKWERGEEVRREAKGREEMERGEEVRREANGRGERRRGERGGGETGRKRGGPGERRREEERRGREMGEGTPCVIRAVTIGDTERERESCTMIISIRMDSYYLL